MILGLGMVDVGRDDGAPARHLIAHELGRDDVGKRRAERLAAVALRQKLLAAEVLADRDILHLGRDDPGPRVGELAHRLAALGAERPPAGAVEERHRARLAAPKAVILGPHLTPFVFLDVAAADDPLVAQRRQPEPDVGHHRRVGIGAGRVVDADRRFARALGQVDLAHRDAQPGKAPALDMDLPRGRQRAGGDRQVSLDRVGHAASPSGSRATREAAVRGLIGGSPKRGSANILSLRRHDPDQVRRVPAEERCLSPSPGLPLDGRTMGGTARPVKGGRRGPPLPRRVSVTPARSARSCSRRGPR